MTIVKQIPCERARPECRLLFSLARPLSPNVLHHCTRLHINLTADQPKKRNTDMSYTITSGLNGKSILYIMHMQSLIFAEAYWWWLLWFWPRTKKESLSCSKSSRTQSGPKKFSSHTYSGRSHLTRASGSAVGQYGQ